MAGQPYSAASPEANQLLLTPHNGSQTQRLQIADSQGQPPALSPVDHGMTKFPKEGLNCSLALAQTQSPSLPVQCTRETWRATMRVRQCRSRGHCPAMIVAEPLYMKARRSLPGEIQASEVEASSIVSSSYGEGRVHPLHSRHSP